MTYELNILAAHRAASAADRAQGLAWYELAHELAGELAAERYSPRACAGVIAAMSPMMSWRSNIDVARRIITRHAAGELEPASGYGMRRNVAKAWRILNGEDPADVLSGPKVRSFFANIVGDPDAVTVDRWAARIARGDAADAGLVTAREYREISTAYRCAADVAGVTPRELQAAVWTYFRRVNGAAHNDPTED